MSGVAVAEPELAAVRRSGPQRLWSAPLWQHLLALALVLVALVPITGNTTSFISDEGLAILQAESLADGEGWIVEHPLPEVDPDGRHYPIEKATQGVKGFAPLPKHPMYPLILAGAARLGGVPAMVGLSLLATVAAAGLAAAIARRIDRRLARPTVWIVGVASPLLLDGFLVIAHTLVAALAAATVLVAVLAIERRSVRLGTAVAPLVAAAVLLRSEALFLALGLVVAGGVLALRRRPALPALTVAAASGGGALAAAIAEKAWAGRILGEAVAALPAPFYEHGSEFLSERLDAFLLTWFTPAYGRQPDVAIPLLVMVAMLSLAAYLTRRPDGARATVVGAAGAGAAVAATIALLTAPQNVVPGLVPAFPVVIVGLLWLRVTDLRSLEARISAGVAAVLAGGILATQYAHGGGVEWGWRYFAAGIPLIVPVLLVAIRRQGSLLPDRLRRAGFIVLVTCSLAMSTMAVGSLRHSGNLRTGFISSVDRASERAGGSRPVVVTTAFSVTALLWPTFDKNRWLFSAPADLRSLGDSLADHDVDRLVLLTYNRARDLGSLPGMAVVSAEGAPDGSGRQVIVLQRAS